MTGDDDLEWDEEPVSLMMGSAQGAGGSGDDDSDDPLDLRWPGLYVPDASSLTGWAVHRVRDRTPSPQARVRRSGFRMRRRK